MRTLSYNVLEFYSVLSELEARCRSHTAERHENEKILPFAAGARHLAGPFDLLSVSVDTSEMPMALLMDFLSSFDSFISGLNATHTDDTKFSYELVQSRYVQEQ